MAGMAIARLPISCALKAGLLLTEGQMSDHIEAKLMYESLPESASHLIGDKGYYSNEFRAALSAKGIKPCIPPRKNRNTQVSYCRKLYKTRHKVENMFGKLKDWRRVATRYDRCAHTYFSAICIAATVIFYLN
jgi:transposase